MRSAPGLPRTAGGIAAGRPPAQSTAMSWAGSLDVIWASAREPSANVSSIVGRALDDVERGQDLALAG